MSSFASRTSNGARFAAGPSSPVLTLSQQSNHHSRKLPLPPLRSSMMQEEDSSFNGGGYGSAQPVRDRSPAARKTLTGNLSRESSPGSGTSKISKEAMAFANRVADLAESAGHHPDIDIRYNKVRLGLISHDAGGITTRDAKMAARLGRELG